VPRDLIHQWQAELKKHANVGADGLHVLVIDKPKDKLPRASEFAKFDIVLFSKSRFEAEHKDGQDQQVGFNQKLLFQIIDISIRAAPNQTFALAAVVPTLGPLEFETVAV
jgi:hypothetical protein